jgi:hypothetical protein
MQPSPLASPYGPTVSGPTDASGSGQSAFDAGVGGCPDTNAM